MYGQLKFKGVADILKPRKKYPLGDLQPWKANVCVCVQVCVHMCNNNSVSTAGLYLFLQSTNGCYVMFHG